MLSSLSSRSSSISQSGLGGLGGLDFGFEGPEMTSTSPESGSPSSLPGPALDCT